MLTNSLDSLPSHIIDGESIPNSGDGEIASLNPYSGEVLWCAKAADEVAIGQAVSAARRAFEQWSQEPHEKRVSILQNFGTIVQRDKDSLTQLVARESGKPLWESRIEVNALATKVQASLEAYKLRCSEWSREVKGLQSHTRFRPHGVMAVLGPYNFPLSMANGHIMPAILAGNAVVFKPSELTPLAGIAMSQIWQESGLPPGVMNCITGGSSTGRALVEHPGVDGILFVGSHAGGLSIRRILASQPQKIAALEMGGNSPLVIEDFSPSKIDAVVSIIIHSAFISSGQRCSAARRLYVHEKSWEVVERLVEVVGQVRLGSYDAVPEPFAGPMIRPEAVQRVQKRFDELSSTGGRPLLQPVISGPNRTIMRPGLIDVLSCKSDRDEEIFGPVLKVSRYSDLTEAIDLANNTRFGLAAGLVTQNRAKFETFLQRVKAGIVNWNQQLTGATTFAPFGGVKQSGNHRPAGFLSADYCSYAVASFEVDGMSLSLPDTPGLTF